MRINLQFRGTCAELLYCKSVISKANSVFENNKNVVPIYNKDNLSVSGDNVALYADLVISQITHTMQTRIIHGYDYLSI